MALRAFSGELDQTPVVKQTGALTPFTGNLDGEAPPNPFIETAKRTGGSIVSSAGTALEDLGATNVGKALRETGEEIVQAHPSQVSDISDLWNKPGIFAQEAIGNVVPQIPLSLAGAWAGGKLGAALPLPPPLRAATAVGGAALGAFAPNLMQEYGEMRDKQRETGIENQGLALTHALPAAGLETLGDVAVLGGRFLPPVLKSAAGGLVPDALKKAGTAVFGESALPAGAGIVARAGHGLKELAKGAVIEGPLTEVPQTYLERAGGGQEVFSPEGNREAILSGALGAVGGGTVRGALGVVAPRREGEQPAAPAGALAGVPAGETAAAQPPQAVASGLQAQGVADWPQMASGAFASAAAQRYADLKAMRDKPAQIMTDQERQELDFLEQHRGNPDALAQGYRIRLAAPAQKPEVGGKTQPTIAVQRDKGPRLLELSPEDQAAMDAIESGSAIPETPTQRAQAVPQPTRTPRPTGPSAETIIARTTDAELKQSAPALEPVPEIRPKNFSGWTTQDSARKGIKRFGYRPEDYDLAQNEKGLWFGRSKAAEQAISPSPPPSPVGRGDEETVSSAPVSSGPGALPGEKAVSPGIDAGSGLKPKEQAAVSLPEQTHGEGQGERWPQVLTAGAGAQAPAQPSFSPTHVLSDGTQVRANLDESGVQIKNEWIDQGGTIVEDDYATSIEQEQKHAEQNTQAGADHGGRSAQSGFRQEGRDTAGGGEGIQSGGSEGRKSEQVQQTQQAGAVNVEPSAVGPGQAAASDQSATAGGTAAGATQPEQGGAVAGTGAEPQFGPFATRPAVSAQIIASGGKTRDYDYIKKDGAWFGTLRRGVEQVSSPSPPPSPAGRGGKTQIDQASHQAATSPHNGLPEPTPAQKEAGNYKKGHVNFQGLDISIENPEGSTRSGTDQNGKTWSVTMRHHYGYIKGTVGKDKDHIDVFIGPNHERKFAYVVDQFHPESGEFDEHKIMLGFDSLESARQGYLDNYAKGWKGLGAITPVPIEGFKSLKEWIASGNTKRPYSRMSNQAYRDAMGTGKASEGKTVGQDERAARLAQIKVKVSGVVAETGRKVTLTDTAENALADVDQRIVFARRLMECLAS